MPEPRRHDLHDRESFTLLRATSTAIAPHEDLSHHFLKKRSKRPGLLWILLSDWSKLIDEKLFLAEIQKNPLSPERVSTVATIPRIAKRTHHIGRRFHGYPRVEKVT